MNINVHNVNINFFLFKIKTFSNLKTSIDNKNILKILSNIQNSLNFSQRNISLKLGISSGLANSYVKRCVSKGWVKIKSVPKKRYIYYLTPKGFLEKSKLTAEYLTSSFELYRNMRKECNQILSICKQKKLKNIYIFGQSELTEVLILTSKEISFPISGLYIAGSNKKYFLDVKIHSSINKKKIDKIIFCEMKDSYKSLLNLQKLIGKEKVIVPKLLNF